MPRTSNAVSAPIAEQVHRRRIACLAARLIGITILSGLIWFTYRPVLDAPLIFDDASTLVDNASLRQLLPLGIANVPTRTSDGNVVPCHFAFQAIKDWSHGTRTEFGHRCFQ